MFYIGKNRTFHLNVLSLFLPSFFLLSPTPRKNPIKNVNEPASKISSQVVDRTHLTKDTMIREQDSTKKKTQFLLADFFDFLEGKEIYFISFSTTV